MHGIAKKTVKTMDSKTESECTKSESRSACKNRGLHPRSVVNIFKCDCAMFIVSL